MSTPLASERVVDRPADRDETDVLNWLMNERDGAANKRDAAESAEDVQEWSRWDNQSRRLFEAINEIESSRTRLRAMDQGVLKRVYALLDNVS